MTGRELKHARLVAGLSQNHLARLSGVPSTTISQCEIGNRRVTAYLRGRIETGLRAAVAADVVPGSPAKP